MTASENVIEPIIDAVHRIDRGVELDLTLPTELFYFRGHFPGRPILPGVVQIDWAIQFADQYLGTNIGSAQKYNVKFRAIIEPSKPLTMVLVHDQDSHRLNFEFRGDKTLLSSGTIYIDPAS
jgi:3-hydroxymyristoyl/3-hydroxydecanoyl-(acyl carrier protein) dehydratase